MKVSINILCAHKVYAQQKIEDLEEKRIVTKMMLRRRVTLVVEKLSMLRLLENFRQQQQLHKAF